MKYLSTLLDSLSCARFPILASVLPCFSTVIVRL